jgi:hypothetical protein
LPHAVPVIKLHIADDSPRTPNSEVQDALVRNPLWSSSPSRGNESRSPGRTYAFLDSSSMSNIERYSANTGSSAATESPYWSSE